MHTKDFVKDWEILCGQNSKYTPIQSNNRKNYNCIKYGLSFNQNML